MQKTLMPSKIDIKSALPLKIGLVLDTSLDPSDGVQQYVVMVGEWLRMQGHDVHYLVGETHERDLPNIHSLARNFTVQFNGNRTTIPLPTSRRKLRAFINHEKFDVLHVQTPHHPLLAQRLVLAADPRTIVVGTFHILPYDLPARWATKALGLWLRPSLKRFDTMLAVSPSAAEFVRWAFGAEAKVLPNVIDYERFSSAQPLQPEDDKLNILFLGRLVQRKGCRYLLEAVAQLDRQALPPFRVTICGKGELMDELKQYVHESAMDDIVTFAGFVSEEDKPRYYADADIAVFPSTGGESFGIVLIEAMAAGRATVLAGNNPGYATVMSPQPALLFEPTDTHELANLLTHYLTDAQARTKMARWGGDYAKRFDVNLVGNELLKLYETLLQSKNV